MPRSWLRFALLAALPKSAYPRPILFTDVSPSPRARRKTRSLSVETLETRRLLTADSGLEFYWALSETGFPADSSMPADLPSESSPPVIETPMCVTDMPLDGELPMGLPLEEIWPEEPWVDPTEGIGPEDIWPEDDIGPEPYEAPWSDSWPSGPWPENPEEVWPDESEDPWPADPVSGPWPADPAEPWPADPEEVWPDESEDPWPADPVSGPWPEDPAGPWPADPEEVWPDESEDPWPTDPVSGPWPADPAGPWPADPEEVWPEDPEEPWPDESEEPWPDPWTGSTDEPLDEPLPETTPPYSDPPPTGNPPETPPETPPAKPVPMVPPKITVQVADVSTNQLVTEVIEGAEVLVTVTLDGGDRPADTFVVVTADVNFDGRIEAGDLSSERAVLKTPGTDGRYRHSFSLPDDGRWPGNGTPSDKLTIRATYGEAEKTFELTIKNVPPRFTAAPVFSLGQDTRGIPVARVEVQLADVGLVDDHVAMVQWSDGQFTANRDFADINLTCGPGGGRSVTVERRLEAGQQVYPVEVRIADDDRAAGSGNVDLSSFRMLHLDLALNDDDDNRSSKPDLAEWLVRGEDDVKSVDLSPLLSKEMTTAAGEFYFSYDTGHIRVWDSADKRKLILPRSNAPLVAGAFNPGDIPTIAYSGQKSVFVEGIADGQSSIVVSWQPNAPLPSPPSPLCAPPSSSIFGGSVEVAVWSIDLDIDSDNNDGLLPPKRDASEEFLEANPFGIGKMLYSDDQDFVPVILEIPPGLESAHPDLTVEVALESVGSSSGRIVIWSRSHNDPDRKLMDQIPPGKIWLPQLGRPYIGQRLFFIAPAQWTRNNQTKEDVDKNGKTDDRLVVTVRAGNMELKDTVKWMVVGPKMFQPRGNLPPAERLTFYPTLQNSRALRSAGAAEAIYAPSSNQNFTLKMLDDDEVRKLLAGRLEPSQIDAVIAGLGGSWNPGIGEPPLNRATIRLYLDHVSLTYILSFKGTDMFNIDDWFDNLQNGLTGNASKYAQAMHVAHLLSQAGIPFHNAGHSLGGGLATAASMVTGMEAYTFNAAGLNIQALYQNDYYGDEPLLPWYPKTSQVIDKANRLIKAYSVGRVRSAEDFPGFTRRGNNEFVEDARDPLTFLQILVSKFHRPDDERIPAAFQAWGAHVTREGLYDLTRRERYALDYIEDAIEEVFERDWTNVAMKLFAAWLDAESLKQKLTDSHSFPSIYYGLLHDQRGWNAYDHTLRKF